MAVLGLYWALLFFLRQHFFLGGVLWLYWVSIGLVMGFLRLHLVYIGFSASSLGLY